MRVQGHIKCHPFYIIMHPLKSYCAKFGALVQKITMKTIRTLTIRSVDYLVCNVIHSHERHVNKYCIINLYKDDDVIHHPNILVLSVNVMRSDSTRMFRGTWVSRISPDSTSNSLGEGCRALRYLIMESLKLRNIANEKRSIYNETLIPNH